MKTLFLTLLCLLTLEVSSQTYKCTDNTNDSMFITVSDTTCDIINDNVIIRFEYKQIVIDTSHNNVNVFIIPNDSLKYGIIQINSSFVAIHKNNNILLFNYEKTLNTNEQLVLYQRKRIIIN